MRRIALFTVSCLVAAGCLAQPKTGTPKMIVGGDRGYMSPVWSPDGKKIAVTSDNFTGIWVTDADGLSLTQLTDEAGAGYKMSWNDSGETILARTNEYRNGRTYHAIKTYNVASKAEETIVEATRHLGVATWRGADAVATTKGGQAAIAKKGASATTASQLSVYEAMVSDPFNALALVAGLEEYAGKPVINPALSPDKTKIAFQIPGKGIFTCNADGSQPASIGKGSYPSWTPDNKYVVAARVTDNGETFTASEIVAIDAATTETTTIFSDSAMIPLTPAVSPDGSRLLFENCADGCIYIMDITY